MTAVAMAYAAAIGVMLALAGLGAERISAIARLPRRWIWAGLIAANLAVASMPWWLTPGDVTPVSVSIDVTTTSMGSSALPALAPSAFQRLRVEVGQASVSLARWGHVGAWMWMLSSGALALLVLARLVVLSRRRRQWTQTTVDDLPVLVSAADGPGVVGTLAPQIVLPAWALSVERGQLDLILQHEREHLAARDPLLIRLAGLSVLLTPWNPASWWMFSRLKLAVEIDCDARVLRHAARATTNFETADYAELLLAVATHSSTSPVLPVTAMLEPLSSLGRRITAMTPTRMRFVRARAAGAAMSALALLALVFAVPVPRARAQAQQRPSPAPESAISSPTLAPMREQAPAPQAPTPAAPAPAAELVTQAPTPAPVEVATEVKPDEFGQGAVKPGYDVTYPKAIHTADPVYTRDAMAAKIQGMVRLEAVIEADGTIKQARVINSTLGTSPEAQQLVDAAVTAAKRWRFDPSTREGVPVPVIVEMELEFRLR